MGCHLDGARERLATQRREAPHRFQLCRGAVSSAPGRRWAATGTAQGSALLHNGGKRPIGSNCVEARSLLRRGRRWAATGTAPGSALLHNGGKRSHRFQLCRGAVSSAPGWLRLTLSNGARERLATQRREAPHGIAGSLLRPLMVIRPSLMVTAVGKTPVPDSSIISLIVDDTELSSTGARAKGPKAVRSTSTRGRLLSCVTPHSETTLSGTPRLTSPVM